MFYHDLALDDNLQKQVDHGSSGLDIMHGELKRMLVYAEEELRESQRIEDETEEAIDSMERRYWEGQCDALEYAYKLTYALSFAIAEREKNG